MTTATKTDQCFNGLFSSFHEEAARRQPAELTALRDAAFKQFCATGFPSVREEEWRFTNVAPVERLSFELAKPAAGEISPDQVSLAGVRGLDSHEIVFVNGHFSAELSNLQKLPQGVIVCSLAEILREGGNKTVSAELGRQTGFDKSAFQALNLAFVSDGAFVHIPKGVVLADPLEILYLSTGGDQPTVSFPRNLIVVEEQGQLTVLENYEGVNAGNTYLTNAVTEIVVRAHANVDYYRLQCEDPGAFHFGSLQVQQEEQSNFRSHAITLGASLSRNDLGLTLVGENCEGTLNGLYMIGQKQLADTHTRIDHAVPNCLSHELYKGILKDDARGVFNGYILVRPDAQKTDAKQTNKCLLLSPTAQINTNPQLEIYADDVKCTHGATIGQLDENSIFYLRSRGIEEHDARCLLTYAFANDIIRRIKIEPLRNQLEDIVLVAQDVKAKPSTLEVK
ncbi:Fe-S cluster assembly protein SufD [candidate division BRC1 bacterium HGW-BRC1-1]|jgi:Fe-S cluster assembly protein SufD|nr:MAG: Fe-S cluster assembly protein SufD [candidate division BRC1 bacterium HGW-BRC1-1]